MQFNQAIAPLVQWLADTPLSGSLAMRPWVVPLVQTVHIACVAIVMSSVCFVNFRMIGIFARQLPSAAVSRRFLPWMWWTMPVLLTTGVILIIVEPARELQNSTFRLKMLLILGALALAAVIQTWLVRDDAVWEGATYKRRLRQFIAVVSITVWVGIVYAGRMIAYTQDG